MADKDHYMPEVDILYTVFYYMYLSLKTFALGLYIAPSLLCTCTFICVW